MPFFEFLEVKASIINLRSFLLFKNLCLLIHPFAYLLFGLPHASVGGASEDSLYLLPPRRIGGRIGDEDRSQVGRLGGKPL